MGWHVLDFTAQDNAIIDCNRLAHNGIGNLGDSHANVEITGNSSIGSGTYMCILKGNTIQKCNQGRAANKIGISIQRTGAGGSYPTASNKYIEEFNVVLDSDVRVVNSQSIPQVKSLLQTTVDSKEDALSFGTVSETGKVVLSENIKSYGDSNWASAGVSNPILLTSSVAGTAAKLSLENSAVNGTTELVVSKLSNTDRTWRWKTHNQDEIKFEVDQGQYGIQQAFRVAKNGNVCFLGQGQSTNEIGSYTLRAMGSVLFEHDKFVLTSLPTTNPSVTNRIYTDRSTVRITNIYSPITLFLNANAFTDYTNTSRSLTQSNSFTYWYRIKPDADLTITQAPFGYPALYNFHFILPLPTAAFQKITLHKLNDSSKHVAFGQETNGNFHVRTPTQYSVSANTCLKITTPGTHTLIAVLDGSTYHWCCSEGAIVAVSSL
jgi:hypothetical protein